MAVHAGRALFEQGFGDRRGNAQRGVLVTVYLAGTTTLATLYTDRTKATVQDNPLSTNGLGNLAIFADPGDYEAHVDSTGAVLEFTVLPDWEDVVTGDEPEGGLPAHLSDAVDAHDASAISFTPAGGVAATDVQAAIVEVAGDVGAGGTALADHLADATDSHDASAVSFVPTGGIAATTVQAALAELDGDKEPVIPPGTYVQQGEQVLSVKDDLVGAQGDGVTDDTALVNYAITTVSALGGGVVWFPPGTYLCRALTLKSGVKLRGPGATLKITGAAIAIWIQGAASSVDIAVEDITLDANSLVTSTMVQPGTSAAGFAVRRCKLINASSAGVIGVDTRDLGKKIVIEDNEFNNVDTPVRVNKDPSNVRIRGNWMRNWGSRAIYVLGTATQAVTDLEILNNIITDVVTTATTRQPIAFSGNDANPFRRVKVNYNTVIGPNLANTTNDGTADQISLHRCEDFEVIGNVSAFGGDVGITIAQQCQRGVVADNLCLSNDAVGIAIGSTSSTHVKHISVHGNVVMNNGQNHNSDKGNTSRLGVGIYNASHVALADNIISDDQGTATQQYAVYAVGSTNVSIADNTYDGNGVGIFYDGGTNTALTFNPDLYWFIPAIQFSVTAGAAFSATILGAAGVRIPAWFFDAAATEAIVCQTKVPTGWRTAIADFYWSHAGGSATEVAVLRLDYAVVGLGTDLSTAEASSANANGTAGAANIVSVSTVGAAFAVDPAKELRLEAARVGGDAADTLVGDLGLLGIMLRRVS